MEIIRKSPGKIYYKSNTSVAIKLLAFLAVALVLLVLGVCIFVIFGFGNAKNYFLDASEAFYYSVNKDAKTARFELYVGKDKNVTIPETIKHKGDTYQVTEIGVQAFTNNKQLATVAIANNVERITGSTTQEMGAFSGCINLTTVKFGNNLRHIDNYAFKNCLALKAVDLPATVQFVGVGAFMNNLALETIKLNGGNTRLDANSFKYCDKITTLALSNDVILDNDKKQALAELSNLTTFVLDDDNTRYITLDDNNDCVLNAAGDTVVICGKRDNEKTFTDTDITKIEDWAFGKRYGSTDIYLPYTVTSVAKNAFSTGIIYTNAASKPEEWQTKLPVRCGAEKITFYRNYHSGDTVTADAYTFTTDPNDTNHYFSPEGDDTFYPKFETLFGEGDGQHAFDKWSMVNGGKCYAEYHNDTPATDFTALNTAITEAETYLLLSGVKDEVKENKRLMFTLAFWEEFKSAYSVAEKLNGNANALKYEVENATENLQGFLSKLKNPDDSITIDINDWRKNLSDFLTTVAVVMDNRDDFVDKLDVWTSIEGDRKTAEERLADEGCTDELGMSAWRVLRMDYEALRVKDNLAETPLNKLIAECANLKAGDWTAESWENFMNALTKARNITQYNMSVSQVRLALQEAKNNLKENNLASHEQLVELAAWLSVCGDLQEGDYTQTSFDQMVIAWRKVNAQFATIDTIPEVQSALKTLRNNYNALIAVDKEPIESGNNTVVGNLVPYFIVALILFTVAIIIQAVASSLKKSQRSKKHE